MKRSFCPLCHHTNLTELAAPPVGIGAEHFGKTPLGLSLCRNCGVRFVNPRPSDVALARFYDSDGYDCHDPAYASAIAPRGEAARLNILSRHIAAGRLLDFGPGAGHLLRAARERGYEVCGVEAGAPARRALSAAGFEVAPSLDEARSPVNAVTMVHTLEHLTDPRSVLEGVRKALAPGGVFYVKVPNVDSLRARLATSPLKPLWSHAPDKYLAFPIHLLYFKNSSLKLLLESIGFRIVEVGTLGLGVEELFTKPVNSGGITLQPENATSVASSSSSSSSLRPIKEFIKATFSRFYLGESLYAVCRPT